jgi:hypothetical protein
MLSANDKQVGGAHYQRQKYQHWDFAIDAGLPYLEGQVTKYIDRHAAKNGRQDFEKALHFLEKLREAHIEDRVQPPPLPRATIAAGFLTRFLAEHTHLSPEERQICAFMTRWLSTSDLDWCLAAGRRRLEEVYGPEKLGEGG